MNANTTPRPPGQKLDVTANVLCGLTQLRLRRDNAEQSMRRAAARGDQCDAQTLRNQHDLAVFLARRGAKEDEREAISIFSKVLSVQERVLGPSHPATHRTASNLARLSGRVDQGSSSPRRGPSVDEMHVVHPSPRLSARSQGRSTGESLCSDPGSIVGHEESFESCSTSRFSEMSRFSFESKASPRGDSSCFAGSFGSGCGSKLQTPSGSALDRKSSADRSSRFRTSFENKEDFRCIAEEGDYWASRSAFSQSPIRVPPMTKHVVGDVLEDPELAARKVIAPPTGGSSSRGVRHLSLRRRIRNECSGSTAMTGAVAVTFTPAPPPSAPPTGMLARLRRPIPLIGANRPDATVGRLRPVSVQEVN